MMSCTTGLVVMCPHFRGWYVRVGPEDVSLLERCPHFRGWYVQASMELGPEDVSLLERCPHFRGWTHYCHCPNGSMCTGSIRQSPEDVYMYLYYQVDIFSQ